MSNRECAALSILLIACGGPTTPESEAPESAAVGEPASIGAEPAPTTAGPVAPDFTLNDLDGKTVALQSFRGKTVVLEWFNPGCPFVKYAHGEGPLKDMAKQKMATGVVWLNINSSAPGKQGNGIEANTTAKKTWAIASPILIDESGTVGHAYGATTTPQMWVIDSNGAIVYRGALDNAPLGKPPADGYVNYVNAALADMAAGRAVKVAETQSYGCSVKYAD